MIHRLLLAAQLGLLFPLVGCDGTTDEQKLQGTWFVVSYTVDGDEAPEEVTSQLRFVIDGDAAYITPVVEYSGEGFRVTEELTNGVFPHSSATFTNTFSADFSSTKSRIISL